MYADEDLETCVPSDDDAASSTATGAEEAEFEGEEWSPSGSYRNVFTVTV